MQMDQTTRNNDQLQTFAQQQATGQGVQLNKPNI